ncbi:MAG: YihY/virulence factor BrkB family protein [Flavobacteriaceae bacterium]|nr:YihY/virulence factor BrkB family protein [Flavobacteriaceae bacterium]
MTKPIEEKLLKIPVVNFIVRLLKSIKIPSFEGLTLYDLLEMYSIGILKGALTNRASAIAFSFFMAIFPFLLFILNVIPYLPIDASDFMGTMSGFLPPKTSEFFDTIVEDIITNRGEGVSYTNLVFAIFLMANGVNAIFAGFEFSYHVKLTRSIIWQYIYSLWVGITLALLLLLTIVVLVYFEFYVVEYLSDLAEKTMQFDHLKGDIIGVKIGQILFFTLMIYIGTSFLYYFGTKEGKITKFFSPGARLTTVLILVTTYLFGIYVTDFARYNELYGSIGALLILMLYIWLNCIILLLGFELNASLNRLKLRNAKK